MLPNLRHCFTGSSCFSSSSSSAIAAAAAWHCFLGGGDLRELVGVGIEARRVVSSGFPYSVSEGMEGGGG